MSHSKGPWEFSRSAARYIIRAYGRSVGMVYDHLEAHQEESLANTNLIIAAPELLEACKEVSAILDVGNTTEPWALELINLCKKAIAKAEGKKL